MKIKKEFAVLFFIIVVLVFYISSEKGEKTHYELPVVEGIQTGDITKIIIRKEGSDIPVVREAGTWLVGDQKYPADSTAVDTMLKDISELRLTALASETKNYSIYELDEKGKIDVQAYKDDSLLRRIGVGKTASSQRHTFVVLDDDPRVFHAEGNIKNKFDKNVSDLRDKKVMTISEDVAELVLKKGKEEIVIRRTTAPVPVDVPGEKEEGEKKVEAGPKWITADGKAVKEGEVDGIIKTLSDFLSDEFIEDKSKDDFTSPMFTATLKGENTYSVSLFEKRDSQYPAVTSESDYPFLISEWKANKIMKDFGSILEEGK